MTNACKKHAIPAVHLMHITEEEANRRINSQNNLLRRLKIPLSSEPTQGSSEVDVALDETQQDPSEPSRDDAVRLAILAGRRHLKTEAERGGRYPQQGNVPPIFRALIGAASKLGTASATARAWGVNPVMAHHYKHGRTGQDRESLGLADQIDVNTLCVRSQVLDILSYTVAKITPESLEDQKAKDLSVIARNLSAIMTSTRPVAEVDRSVKAQVIVFSPETEKETQYETIEVG